MSQRRQVVFSARDESILSLVNQMKQASTELGNILTKNSDSEFQSTKKNIDAYEKQIRLIEKRNQVEKQGRASSNASGGDKEKRKPSNNTFEVDRMPKQSSREDDCCKTKIQLLREILQRITDTSQEQISNRSELFEKLSAAGGSGSGSSEWPGIGGGTAGGRGGDGGNSRAGIGDALGMLGGGRLGGLAKAGPYAAAAALIVGMISTMKTLFTNEMKREESFTQLSGVTGMSSSGINKYLAGGYFGRAGVGKRDRSTYGFSEEEFYQRMVPTVQARGTSRDINDAMLDNMALERGTGLSSDSIFQMERLSRVTEDMDATRMTQRLFRSMRDTGAFGSNNADLARLQEMTQGFVQYQEGQFGRTGDTSSSEYLNLRRRLELTGEDKFKRDDYASGTIESLNQGLASPGSPEAEALKMDILRRQNPNKGYFELQAEMDKGIGANGLLEGMMSMVRGTGGNINQQATLLDQMTGGSMRKSDILSLLKGDVNVDGINKQVGYKGEGLDIEKRAAASTSDLRDSLEGLKGEIQKFGQDFLEFNRLMNGSLPNIVKGVDEIAKMTQ